MKYKFQAVLVLSVMVGILIGGTVFGEGNVATKDEVICESCWAFSYVDLGSEVFINGKEEGDLLPVSSLLAQRAAGEIYNHYSVIDVSTSAPSIETEPSVTRAVSTVVSIQGEQGETVGTSVEGSNERLLDMIKTHLERNGFSVNTNVNADMGQEVSITYTEAQARTFFSRGDLRLLASLTSQEQTSEFKAYSKAIQDALNEYKSRKSVWLWDSKAVSDRPDETIQFLDSHHMNHVYLHYNPLVEDHYPYFISSLNQLGITVHALMGAPHWGLEKNIPEGKHRMDRVMVYNNEVSETAQFKGIHFDIEPHVLDEWDTDRENVVTQWSNSSQIYVDYAKDNGFIVGSDLPFWTDGPSVAPYDPDFYKNMIDRQDYVTVMAYRNTALGSNSITSLSENEVLYANSSKVEIGVELKPHYLDYVSFDDKTHLEMEYELAEVRRYFERMQVEGFAGTTYHSYTQWKDLRSR
ncbi:poly-gamma-glutamate hydrolase family protein [Pontibacillus sp. ALD_SL1]|uniref:poly-gamma-glutamate hydrolase family protein n=1 Tax=Pontibacillus sp. ALD_SL1 TaxID=2777185 RepID=UPI001A95AFEC|nr:poly-gamma-glutamate hydrolase family protein [Pontibacillus sp. ALD_SL1]QSS98847.1 poly-gamma-glutamate hydrolase family protein [Pontibacillus sp. ALD_SL1]